MKKLSMFSWATTLKNRFISYFQEEVPEDMAACEFDCRELECREETWVNCPKRKKSKIVEPDMSIKS